MATKKRKAKAKKDKEVWHSRPKRERTDAGAAVGLGRPIWQGQLRLSLVSAPVALYRATSRTNDISFHLLNPETHNRIRMIPTDPETGPVPRSELVRGYEFEKDRYVIVSEEELDAVKLKTTHMLEIDRFVDAETIDRLYWNDPYFLLPDSTFGVDAYVVLRDAIAHTGRIALGRVVMHTRERLMALEPRGKGIVAYSLRVANEVLSIDKAFRDVPNVKPEKQMIEIAEKIIDQQEGPFAPAEFKDRYEDALRDLIRRKQRGEKITAAPPPDESNVIDLMDALRRSLKGKGASPRARRSAAAVIKQQKRLTR